MKKTFLFTSLAVVLFGCSDDDAAPVGKQSISYSGKAIDGYLVGAEVFLDANMNGVVDSNEPIAITKEGGEFNLTIPAELSECAQYVPVVVNVPVGAIDEELGEVTEAYRLVIPPSYNSEETRKVITPITTALWNSLTQGNEVASCDDVMQGYADVSDALGQLERTIQEVEKTYNIPRDRLFSDYIEVYDTEVKSLAVTLVNGLKKSFAETLTLQDSYSDMYVNVFYRVDSKGEWYKRTDILGLSGSSDESTQEEYYIGTDINSSLGRLVYRWKSQPLNSDELAKSQSFSWSDLDNTGECRSSLSTTYDDVMERYVLSSIASSTSVSAVGCDYKSGVNGRYEKAIYSFNQSKDDIVGRFATSWATYIYNQNWDEYFNDPSDFKLLFDGLNTNFDDGDLQGSDKVVKGRVSTIGGAAEYVNYSVN